jgi:hypothetical protein
MLSLRAPQRGLTGLPHQRSAETPHAWLAPRPGPPDADPTPPGTAPALITGMSNGMKHPIRVMFGIPTIARGCLRAG